MQVEVHEDAQTRGRLRLDLALADLQQAFGLDRNADGELTWGELRSQAPEVQDYVRRHLTLRVGSDEAAAACSLPAPDVLIDEHADGPYAVFVYTVDCLRADARIEVDYRLLYEVDPAHRALLRVSVDGQPVASSVLSENSPRAEWTAGREGFFDGFASWIAQGIWHIWTGLDHILFLATLLLAAGTVMQVVRIVSAFTVSHSVTLVCGALGYLRLDSRWVEAAIALTVLFGAINLVVPVVRRRLWLLALVFGLVHGLGFASVLAGLQLQVAHLVRDLVGFNLGVEIGQLAIVVALDAAVAICARAPVVPACLRTRSRNGHRRDGRGVVGPAARVGRTSPHTSCPPSDAFRPAGYVRSMKHTLIEVRIAAGAGRRVRRGASLRHRADGGASEPAPVPPALAPDRNSGEATICRNE